MNANSGRTALIDAPPPYLPVTAEAASAGLDLVGVSVAARCAYYQQVCQLPAVLDPDSGQLIVSAGRVQAVMMPSALGHRVRIELDRTDADSGPIVSHPKSRSCPTPSRGRGHSSPRPTARSTNSPTPRCCGSTTSSSSPPAFGSGSRHRPPSAQHRSGSGRCHHPVRNGPRQRPSSTRSGPA